MASSQKKKKNIYIYIYIYICNKHEYFSYNILGLVKSLYCPQGPEARDSRLRAPDYITLMSIALGQGEILVRLP